MRNMKLMMCDWMMAGRAPGWRTAFVAMLTALVFLSAGAPALVAQEPDSDELTNDVVAAEVLARISEMVQSAQSGQFEDAPNSEELARTNALPQVGGSAAGIAGSNRSIRSESTNRFSNTNRSQNEDRRTRSRRPSRSRSGGSSSANSSSGYSNGNDRSSAAGAFREPSGGPTNLDYAAFQMIVDRNIFNPNRQPRKPGPASVRLPPKQVDSLTLVGTMSYEKGTFAFFDGTSSEYQKALKLTDAIAGYRVTNIMPDAVTLASGTNQLEMHVGMQLRREEHGPWTLTSRSGSYTTTSTPPSTNAVTAAADTGSDAASSAAESETIKRLKQRRAQE